MTLSEIEKLCVLRFELRATRERLYYALEEVVQALLRLRIPCEILCNGSFLTERVDPGDVDIVVRLDSDVAEVLNVEQNELIDALGLPRFAAGIDSFVDVVLPRDHPQYGFDESISWEAHYGLEHSERWLKGVAVLRLGETDVGLRLRR